jgi:hypothetical protein
VRSGRLRVRRKAAVWRREDCGSTISVVEFGEDGRDKGNGWGDEFIADECDKGVTRIVYGIWLWMKLFVDW